MRTSAVRRPVFLAFVLATGSASYLLACGGGDGDTNDAGLDVQTTDQSVPDVMVPDSGSDAAADAPVETGPACNLSDPFATPTVLSSLNNDAGANTRGARLSTDYLTAYYQYGNLLFTAKRSSPSGDTFGSYTELSSLNADAGASSNPTVSSDQLTIYFASTRAGTSQIYFATRASTSDPFGSPGLVAGLPTGALSAPFLQGDGSTLYFVASGVADAGTGSADIWSAKVNSAGSVTNPVEVAELNTTGPDGPVGVTADGLTAYFSRLQSIDGGPANHFKIWKATRTSTSDPFSNIVAAAELEGPDSVNDDMAWVSNDGCQVTLSSFRTGGSNIFIANK